MLSALAFAFPVAFIGTAVQLLSASAAVLLVAWGIGGVVLRIAGIATVATGLLVALGGHPIGLLLAAAGALLWTTGHWHYALRHHTYKSPLARRLFIDLLPGHLDPTRGWSIPTHHDR